MKFYETEKLEIFATFIDDEISKYFRVVPRGNPIWYKASPNGFDLIGNLEKYTLLEATYNEYEQQESKKQRDST